MAEAGAPLTARARGLALRGLRFGDAAGRPVLALHGWLDNAHSFVPLARHLPECCLHALELPGHGHSDHHAADAEYHMIDYLQDVLEALDGWGWERCHLVGHSMGAAIAALLAGAFPERVQSLVLLDGLGPLVDADDALPQRLRLHRLDTVRLRRRQPRLYPGPAALAAQLRRVVPHLSAASALLLSERGCAPAAAGDGQVVHRADPRLRGRSLQRLTEAQVRACLRRIAAPSLLVRPEDGYPFDPDLLAARAACIARLRTCRLPGGHHVHMEQPRRVAGEMQGLWAAAAAQPAAWASGSLPS